MKVKNVGALFYKQTIDSAKNLPVLLLFLSIP